MPFQVVLVNFLQLLFIIPKAIILTINDYRKYRKQQKYLSKQLNNGEIDFGEFIERGGKFL